MKPAVIAEIKKPLQAQALSAQDFNPVKKTKEYEEMGATTLSILKSIFMGSDKYLEDVKNFKTSYTKKRFYYF